jgi:hypothetical protein
MDDTTRNSIVKSARATRNKLTSVEIGGIEVYGIDANPAEIRPYLSKVNKKLLRNVDTIYYGTVEFLEEQGKTGLYRDGCLYLSNKNTQEILPTIMHELSHSLERLVRNELPDRKDLIEEFTKKRLDLFKKLYDAGYTRFSREQFMQTSFDPKLDELLAAIDQNDLRLATNGVFPTAYAATSIEEYVAGGFESFYAGNKFNLGKNCPALYNFIREIEGLIT